MAEKCPCCESISHWIDVRYTDNPKLQKIIQDLLACATASQMSIDGQIHRKKFKQSAKNTIEELERLLK